MNPKKTD